MIKEEALSACCVTETGRFGLNYYLLKEQLGEKSIYGIEIEKLSEFCVIESDRVLGISDDYKKAREIFYIIWKGMVTPYTLAETIDNFVC